MQDHGGLLLLATAAGNANMVEKLGVQAEQAGKHNVSFLSYFMLGQVEPIYVLVTELKLTNYSWRSVSRFYWTATGFPRQLSSLGPIFQVKYLALLSFGESSSARSMRGRVKVWQIQR